MGKYNNDSPIKDQAEDLYNRQEFISGIVKLLEQTLTGDKSFTIGLYAKWGYGKTSCLNLLTTELKTNQNFKIIKINAWSLNGDANEIAWQILENIEIQLLGKKKKRKARKIGKWLKNASLPLGLEASQQNKINESTCQFKINGGALINTGTQALGTVLNSIYNPQRLKEILNKKIKNNKVIVMIDDLDRISGEQILQIFRVISNIINHKNITYILAFDNNIVSDTIQVALNNGENGSDFLDKIIQMPLEIPKIDQYILDEQFISNLNSILELNHMATTESEWNRFNQLFYGENLDHYITSPRDITRISNILNFLMPTIYEEINLVDAICLEIIHEFNPRLYSTIYDNKNLLLQGMTNLNQVELEKLLKAQQKQDIGILTQFFPQTSQSKTDTSTFDKDQRLASSSYFDTFFTLSHTKLGVSDKELLHIMRNAKTYELIYERLSSIITDDNYNAALNVVSSHKDIIVSKIEFCKALLIKTPSRGDHDIPFANSTLSRAIIAIDEILASTEDKKLKSYIELTNFIIEQKDYKVFTYLFCHIFQYSKNDITNKIGQPPLLDSSEIEAYKKAILNHIKNIASKNLIPTKNSGWAKSLYLQWAEIDSHKNIESYITPNIKNASDAIDFIILFLDKWSEISGKQWHYSDLDQSTYKNLEKVIYTDYIYKKLITNPKYSKFKGIKESQISVFSDAISNMLDKTSHKKSLVGSIENDNDFRNLLAQQFIFLHEHRTTSQSVES